MFGAVTRHTARSSAGVRAFSTSNVRTYQSRLSQFYHNTLRDDLTILSYVPPTVRARQQAAEVARQEKAANGPSGTPPNPVRSHKQRVKKAKEPEPTAHNAPHLEKVTVHIRCREALQNKHHLLSALMALQTITGQRAEIIKASNDGASWKLRKGMPISAKVDLTGDRMYEFVDKLVELVLPRMKEYNGLKMDAGDGHGNFSVGFDSSVIGLFPEMEMVYDQFPLVTGFTVNFKTSAVRNPSGRLLMSGFNLPFLHARKQPADTFRL
ncbi:ribosomal protein [Linderina pennispora]|nr:ribosomal protein [Linderina pennispora]